MGNYQSRLSQYETEKRRLQNEDLSPNEYETKIHALARRFKI